MVPEERQLIDIGHKYNARKFLYFIFTNNAGSTKSGTTHLSKYPNPFYNVDI